MLAISDPSEHNILIVKSIPSMGAHVGGLSEVKAALIEGSRIARLLPRDRCVLEFQINGVRNKVTMLCNQSEEATLRPIPAAHGGHKIHTLEVLFSLLTEDIDVCYWLLIICVCPCKF